MADENVLDTRPKGTMVAIFTPPWWVDMAAAKNGSILQVHHPEHGWLAFVFPPEHAAMLGAALVKHSGAVRVFRGDAAAIDGDGELTIQARVVVARRLINTRIRSAGPMGTSTMNQPVRIRAYSFRSLA